MVPHLFQSPTKQGYVAIQPGDLRLGMQVWVDLPWYKHPFPTNRFKLTTPKQLDTIRSLALPKLYYHPASSEPQSVTAVEPESTRVATGLHDLPESIQESAEQSKPLAVMPRAAFQEANKVYAQTLRSSREILRQVTHGNGSEAAAAAHEMVTHFAQQLTEADASLGLADVLHLSGLDQPHVVHGLNTCLLALLVARDLELSPNDLTLLGMAALFHDVGEQRLPSSMRFKTEAFTRPEQLLFQTHPTYSRDIVRDIKSLPSEVGDLIIQHHEYLDGSGYPRGLRAEAIHPLAQILHVVDTYQELINPGPGKVGLQPNQALSELYVKRSTQLSPKVITTLVRALGVYPPGTRVQLSDGSMAVVASVNPVDRLRPVVIVYELGANDLTSRLVDLGEESALTIVRMVGLDELGPVYGERITPQEVLHFMLVTDRQASTGKS